MVSLRRLLADERGEDLIEYGLLAAFVASVAFAAIISDVTGIRASIISAFGKAKSALNNA